MTKVCVLLAQGFEEIEAVTIIDVLRRADVQTTTVGVMGRDVEGAHGIPIQADALLSDVANQKWDWVVLPGGMPGSAHLRDREDVQSFLSKQHKGGASFGAICAAPIALAKAGLLNGLPATSFPGFEKELSSAQYLKDEVVVTDRVVTSRGPGTALSFALSLVQVIRGKETRERLSSQMLVSR